MTVNYENGDPLTVDLANQGWTDGSDTDIVSVTRYRPDGMVEQQIDNYVNGIFTATAPITDQITLFEYDALSRPITTTLNYDPPTLGTRTDTNRASVTAYDPTTGAGAGPARSAGALGQPAVRSAGACDHHRAELPRCWQRAGIDWLRGLRP